ncbi:MAG TPA: extracellular solute-binding protein [Streptosporangiaceae bacterium]|jgi:multiple sugar transport system substrate-binding protein|nr:extracellular solute-binding protein [Streptosporangiaceae bacterium]
MSRRWFGVAAGTAVLLAAAACSSSPSKPVSAGAKQTIVFAESGLGTEGQQTQVAINNFEKANPNITVHIQVLSSDSTTYLSQLEHAFISGSTTPDVFESDVTYPAKFAQAGWALPLDSFHPDMSQFFPHEVAAGTFGGKTYAIPWFDNPEGLYYRTDLIPTPPTSPAQVVSDAQTAMKRDPSLKEGLAFEAAKYEGAITSFLTVDSAFGGTLNPGNIDTPGNAAALNWLHAAIYTNHIAPTAVTGWQEGQVEQEFVSGHAAFAIDYPFVESLATAPPVKGHVGYIPFPAGPGGTPGSALGGEMLAINAKTAHSAAAWKLIQYLTSPSVEVARAEVTGDPPSLPSAYTAALYAKAPYFANVKTLNNYSAPRPVSPNYLTVSNDLQVMLSSVYAASSSSAPAAALKAAAPAIKKDASATPGS